MFTLIKLLIEGPSDIWTAITNSPRVFTLIGLVCEVSVDTAIYLIMAGICIVTDIIQIMEGTNLVKIKESGVPEPVKIVIILVCNNASRRLIIICLKKEELKSGSSQEENKSAM